MMTVQVIPAASAARITSPRGQDWKLTRYRAYQEQLAGRTIGETFKQASAFLDLVSGIADSHGDIGEQATP